MLQLAFQIDEAQAEEIMGSAGKGFKPKEPEPVVMPGAGPGMPPAKAKPAAKPFGKGE